METLLAARPKLLENRAFVETWLPRLAPPDGLDPDRDPAVRLAWLERLQAFADKLPPAFNTIKASILFQRLAFDLKQNTPDAARLVAYLKLPRPVPYLNPVFRERQDLFQNQADLSTDLTALTGQGPITDDTALVRRTLLILLAKSPDPGAFQPWLEASFLNALLAEARQLKSGPVPLDLETVYFGGGTPTLLSTGVLAKLLPELARTLDFQGVGEWTMEVNPRTITAEKAEVMRQAGVSRVSLGVQAWDVPTLATLGRDHAPEEAEHALDRKSVV